MFLKSKKKSALVKGKKSKNLNRKKNLGGSFLNLICENNQIFFFKKFHPFKLKLKLSWRSLDCPDPAPQGLVVLEVSFALNGAESRVAVEGPWTL